MRNKSTLDEHRDKLGIAQGTLRSEVTSCFALKSKFSKFIEARTCQGTPQRPELPTGRKQRG